jgi:hypothetical protein
MEVHLKRNDKLLVVDDWTNERYELVRMDFELGLRKCSG